MDNETVPEIHDVYDVYEMKAERESCLNVSIIKIESRLTDLDESWHEIYATRHQP
jgi:hypothetical protein